MASIKFEKHSHKCYTEQKGEWVIFRCHQCPNYERRINVTTGKMKNINTDSEFLHQGFHVQPGTDYKPN